jgi:TonB family protein
MKRLLLALLFITQPLIADDAAKIALSVRDAAVDSAQLAEALKSPDAVTRATSSRVGLVRGVEALVPQLRDALASETVAETAREEVRALVLLGSDEDVAFAASQLKRFPGGIDSDFALAVGRIGAPRAVDLYLKYRDALRDPFPGIKYALWGRAPQASLTMSRLFAANDAKALGALLAEAGESGLVLDPGILTAALSSHSPEVVTSVLWYLVTVYIADPAAMPESVRALASAPREGASEAEAVARALIARMLGASADTRPLALAWLRSPEGHGRVTEAIVRYLTKDEGAAYRDSLVRPPPPGVTMAVREPFFTLPVTVPYGLAQRLLAETGCRGGWLGVGAAVVDRAGRVQSLRLGRNTASSRGCTTALETMLRLSLAEPSTITAPFGANGLLLVKPADAAGLEESRVDDFASGEALRVGGAIIAPKVRRRVEPHFPRSALQSAPRGTPLVVVLEALITRSGAVRDVRILSQTSNPEINGAAAAALAQWTFEPGTYNGRPVDVIFTMTVTFRRD